MHKNPSDREESQAKKGAVNLSIRAGREKMHLTHARSGIDGNKQR